MKQLFILFFFYCLNTLKLFAQNNADSILNKSFSFYKKNENGNMRFSLKMKQSNISDTFFYKAQAIFQKNKTNKPSVFLDIITKERNPKEIFIKRSMHENKSYFVDTINLIYDVDKRNVFEENVWFLNEIPIIKTDNFFEKLKKTKINLQENENYFILKNKKQEIFVNKKNYQIEKIIIQFKSEDGIEYRIYEIISQTYNQNIYQNPELYIIKDPKYLKIQEEKEFLEIKTKAPNWKHISVQNQDTLTLSQFKGKVIVLDFWYASCPPCLESFPIQKKIYEKFKDKNVIFIGMALETDKILVSKFLNKYYGDTSYLNVLCTDQTIKDYKIIGYPSFVIIDKEGKISYNHTGTYSMEKKLIQNIENALKK